jgi:hypothetical protein
MDDQAIYGPRAHTLTFAAAVKLGVICPYKVVITLIDKKMVDDFVLRHGITLVETDLINARWVHSIHIRIRGASDVFLTDFPSCYGSTLCYRSVLKLVDPRRDVRRNLRRRRSRLDISP